MAELAQVRDAYVEAFNKGDFPALEAKLHPEAVYRWVTASRSEQGREAVMKLYEMGHNAYNGRSRLCAVPGTEDQAIWWEPKEEGLVAAGLQTLTVEDGLIREIADAHSPVKVAELAAGLEPPE